jgi:hypothetical protein
MKFFLLDAGGAAILLMIPLAIIVFVLLWGFVEGFIIHLFGINRFWKSIWHAIIVNLISLVAGFVMVGITSNMGVEKFSEIKAGTDYLWVWAVYWAVSVVVEALVLKGLNRLKSWSKIFLASVIMNLATYIIIYAFVFYNHW